MSDCTGPGTTAQKDPGSTILIPLGTMPDSSLGLAPQYRSDISPGWFRWGDDHYGAEQLLTAEGPGRMVPAEGAYMGDGMPPVLAKLAAKVRR